MSHIDYCLYFHGGVSRSDLERRFGISVAAASRDLACYRGLAPSNLVYDGSDKVYRIGEDFRPINAFSTDRVLSWLRQGFGDGLALGMDRPIAADCADLLAPPSIEMLGILARAIYAGRVLRIKYLSLSSGASSREIVPLAFVDNGQRWHVRAYDRKNGRFADFVVNRIELAKVSESAPEDCESLIDDRQWNSSVSLEIVPHPGVRHPEAVAADYGMKRGVLVVTTRAAIAGYALARWNVDSTRKHSLSPLRHHLWLRNAEVLRDVESAALAPGYAPAQSEVG
ncbi:hypothetical protein AZOA_39720 [Azoarcus sp. Aa7]|nr:hypothetical protein [Azoarcus sp. Aa7]